MISSLRSFHVAPLLDDLCTVPGFIVAEGAMKFNREAEVVIVPGWCMHRSLAASIIEFRYGVLNGVRYEESFMDCVQDLSWFARIPD